MSTGTGVCVRISVFMYVCVRAVCVFLSDIGTQRNARSQPTVFSAGFRLRSSDALGVLGVDEFLLMLLLLLFLLDTCIPLPTTPRVLTT